MPQPRICDPGQGGWFLGAPSSTTRPDFLLGLVYAVCMIYFFMGVAVISDLFMGSIEQLTSARRQSGKSQSGDIRTSKVWNETVATLTLMALGSSAPEIFLSVIETFKKGFHSGEIGPSTIVGSAAFNLYVIIAVCVYVIPHNELRRIENIRAFHVTGAFSVAAYLWMVVVLALWTPDIVTIPEALLTFLFLPCLVWISWSIDVGWLGQFFGESSEAAEDVSQLELGKICLEKGPIQTTGTDAEQTIEVWVTRTGDTGEQASCAYSTEAYTAAPEYDFEKVEGNLTFEKGQSKQSLQIKVMPKALGSVRRQFLLVLTDAEGAVLDPEADGGEDETILSVIIDRRDGDQSTSCVDSVFNTNAVRHEASEWADHFWSIFYVNGSAEEQSKASLKDWILHILVFPWNLVFVVVPPPYYGDGVWAFVVSISIIGLVTGVVSDLAELFGCVIDIPDIVTAVTFVALGTSMPDLFASLTAAREDPTADASIVNVTGSNSVNVFLGLGVPWICASCYWEIKGRNPDWETRYPEVAARIPGAAYVMESGNLSFSVLAYTVTSLLALAVLVARRHWVGGELGGPAQAKFATSAAFISLWLGWVVLTSWRVLRQGKSEASESIGFIVVVFLSLLGMTLWALASAYQSRNQDHVEPETKSLKDVEQERNGHSGPEKIGSSVEDNPQFDFHDPAEVDLDDNSDLEVDIEDSSELKVRVDRRPAHAVDLARSFVCPGLGCLGLKFGGVMPTRD